MVRITIRRKEGRDKLKGVMERLMRWCEDGCPRSDDEMMLFEQWLSLDDGREERAKTFTRLVRDSLEAGQIHSAAYFGVALGQLIMASLMGRDWMNTKHRISRSIDGRKAKSHGKLNRILELRAEFRTVHPDRSKQGAFDEDMFRFIKRKLDEEDKPISLGHMKRLLREHDHAPGAAMERQ